MDGLEAWLGGRAFDDWRADFDRDGYVIFPSVLDASAVERLRTALAPHFNHKSRNDFEGLKTNRVYALLAKDRAFAELAEHPLALAFAEADLGHTCLLSACLAINLLPGESVQPWHTDDGHIHVPQPHPPFGVSTFWTLDDTTEDNGATELIPGSHLWSHDDAKAIQAPEAFQTADWDDPDHDPFPHPDAVKATMPEGSLMIAKGALLHRGGANRSGAPRLIITPQYCAGWARPLETMIAAVPPALAATYSTRVRELIGYSIHPPFMGYVDGMHPGRLVPGAQ